MVFYQLQLESISKTFKLAWQAIPTLDAQKDAVTHNVLLKNGMTNLAKIQGEKVMTGMMY